MPEILSQSQIDELLNSMLTGGGDTAAEEPKSQAGAEAEPEIKWKKYDFSSPKKFTKDKLKLLKGVYDNYTRLISLRLNGILRAVCEAEVYTVEEQRYFEFGNMLSDNDVMMIVNVKESSEHKTVPMMFHITQKLALNMIDRMLGGPGNEDDIDPSYTYTEIESVLYEKIMGYMIDVTKNAWSNYADITLGDRRYEENPGLFQEIGLDEPVVIVPLNIKMNDTDGRVTMCIPGEFLMQIFSAIDKKKYVDVAYDEIANTSREKIMDSIEESTLEVKAKLSGATLDISDIYNLRVGDIVDLNKPKDTEVEVYIEDKMWFEGSLGVFNKNTAVQLTKRVNTEEDEEILEGLPIDELAWKEFDNELSERINSDE